MPGIHGDLGPADWPSYYEKDEGCKYSEGRGCRDCPFLKCYLAMSHKERGAFIAAWRRNKAIEWRLKVWEVRKALFLSEEYGELLSDGWEPFTVVPNGMSMEIWFRRLPKLEQDGHGKGRKEKKKQAVETAS